MGVAAYLVGCFGIYQLKKERSLPITHEEVIIGIKKGTISQIVVVKEFS